MWMQLNEHISPKHVVNYFPRRFRPRYLHQAHPFWPFHENFVKVQLSMAKRNKTNNAIFDVITRESNNTNSLSKSNTRTRQMFFSMLSNPNVKFLTGSRCPQGLIYHRPSGENLQLCGRKVNCFPPSFGVGKNVLSKSGSVKMCPGIFYNRLDTNT